MFWGEDVFQLQKFYGGADARAQGEAPRKNETRVKNLSVFTHVLGRRCVPATKNGPGGWGGAAGE